MPLTHAAVRQFGVHAVGATAVCGSGRVEGCARLPRGSPSPQAVRTIKGILNKLTPEKFDRLLNQMLEVITTADVLQKTIGLVFENAVEQPTYCAMYAELCVRLSHELPSFPPPPGSNKPLQFKQILLNTCQDEFEGAENAREVRAAGVRGARLRGRGEGVIGPRKEAEHQHCDVSHCARLPRPAWLAPTSPRLTHRVLRAWCVVVPRNRTWHPFRTLTSARTHRTLCASGSRARCG